VERPASNPTSALADSPTLSPAHSSTAVAAVFDVDNTLLPGATSERLFIGYLMRNGHYGTRATLATLASLVRHVRLGPFGALRTHRPYLRGRLAADVARLADQVFTTQILPRLSPIGAARVRWHQERGHLVALLSGSPQFLVSLLAQHLGVTTVMGAPLALQDERYTGALDGLHPYGERKAILTRRFAEEHDVALPASYAYADHHSDALMLKLFGHPVCVNATPRLRQIARANGWPIEDWSGR
jgi:HAD superfamily hydrolase (TIGR01490 family)